MRIAVVSPLEMRVPPVGYGGTEMIVSLLTEALVRQHHDVTLFASGDSVTSARLVPGCERYLRGTNRHKGILTMLNVMSCLERADEFDIIHNHTTFEGLATAGFVKTPMLSTLHGGLSGDWRILFDRYGGWYSTISRSAKSLLPPKDRFAGVIHNGIDCSTYPYNGDGRDDFLLYLSRISHEKGTHLAIEAASRLGRKLIIAGNVDDVDRQYFQTKVLPRVDGDMIEYIGEADYHVKRDLLTRASCLLAPITWCEPFGLFMVEAMVCGTPVVAFNRGSVPEVVRHGETGFVVGTMEEMIDAVRRVDEISHEACRAHVEANFDAGLMVSRYVAAYERIIDAGSWPGRLRYVKAPENGTPSAGPRPELVPEAA